MSDRKKDSPRRRPDVWVTIGRDGWNVKFAGCARPIVTRLTQLDAAHIGRACAKVFRTELLVQNQQGQIRYRDSHGNDPFPPRG